MNQNYGTARAALLLGVVVLILIALHYVPPTTFGGYEVKTVNVLSDVMPDEEEEEDTTLTLPQIVEVKKKEVQQDTVPAGMTCIEDFGAACDSCHGMRLFYQKLSNARSLSRPVRVAYFGDSFIEGDIITEDLRTMLQNRFGGCGVGFVDIASPFTKLRATVAHKSGGWTDHNVLNKKGCDRSRLGITGRYALGDSGAWVRYKGVRSRAHLDTFEVATLYLSSSVPVGVSVSVNGNAAEYNATGGGRHVEAISRSGRIGQVRFQLGDGAATAYGAALEGRSGVTVDNFSMRGSSGMHLTSIPPSHLSQLYSVRPYDLVVLQFGLNVAAKGQMKYGTYISRMKNVIRHFKQAFPHAAILVVSVGDRENKEDGTLRTMKEVKALARYQQAMAADEGVGYWNLFNAMGGDGAIRRMAAAKPAQAERDYTHINRRGGKTVATKLYEAIIFGYEQYLKRGD